MTIVDTSFSATGSWGADNTILFTPTGASPLFRVTATAGASRSPVTRLDQGSGDVQHSYPAFLPDGRRFIYTALGSRAGANEVRALYVGSLDGKAPPPKLLLEGGSNAKYANGYLLFYAAGRSLRNTWISRR